jgi:AbrB family looped-hinge helix DNA binding protein
MIKVGPKGQIIIPKELRDRLGIEPGWLAVPTLVNDHVEVYFFPPEHRNSLKGSLAKYIKEDMTAAEEDWGKIKEEAWAKAIEEEADRWEPTS